uniref:Uncharacterized protein n=1 Tax=Anguilla anguilla TaxID=7936 RepID=A0A0E9XHJ4_ANGAN
MLQPIASHFSVLQATVQIQCQTSGPISVLDLCHNRMDHPTAQMNSVHESLTKYSSKHTHANELVRADQGDNTSSFQ